MTPFEPDTDDLRRGPEISVDLLALLPLVGTWRGAGRVLDEAEEHDFEQEITFAHDGSPFLVYESRVRSAAAVGRPVRRERGFWQVGVQDDVEATLASEDCVEVLRGTATHQRWELATAESGFIRESRGMAGERRLYAVQGDDLLYAIERRPFDDTFDYRPYVNARLTRVRATARPGGG